MMPLKCATNKKRFLLTTALTLISLVSGCFDGGQVDSIRSLRSSRAKSDNPLLKKEAIALPSTKHLSELVSDTTTSEHLSSLVSDTEAIGNTKPSEPLVATTSTFSDQSDSSTDSFDAVNDTDEDFSAEEYYPDDNDDKENTIPAKSHNDEEELSTQIKDPAKDFVTESTQTKSNNLAATDTVAAPEDTETNNIVDGEDKESFATASMESDSDSKDLLDYGSSGSDEEEDPTAEKLRFESADDFLSHLGIGNDPKNVPGGNNSKLFSSFINFVSHKLAKSAGVDQKTAASAIDHHCKGYIPRLGDITNMLPSSAAKIDSAEVSKVTAILNDRAQVAKAISYEDLREFSLAARREEANRKHWQKQCEASNGSRGNYSMLYVAERLLGDSPGMKSTAYAKGALFLPLSPEEGLYLSQKSISHLQRHLAALCKDSAKFSNDIGKVMRFKNKERKEAIVEYFFNKNPACFVEGYRALCKIDQVNLEACRTNQKIWRSRILRRHLSEPKPGIEKLANDLKIYGLARGVATTSYQLGAIKGNLLEVMVKVLLENSMEDRLDIIRPLAMKIRSLLPEPDYNELINTRSQHEDSLLTMTGRDARAKFALDAVSFVTVEDVDQFISDELVNDDKNAQILIWLFSNAVKNKESAQKLERLGDGGNSFAIRLEQSSLHENAQVKQLVKRFRLLLGADKIDDLD